MGAKIILTGNDLGDLADVYQNLQVGLLVVSLLFLLLSVLLFVKFNLKNYLSVIMKHNQKKVSEKYRPKNVAAQPPTTRRTQTVNPNVDAKNDISSKISKKLQNNSMETEQLSGEMTELLDANQETEVLSEDTLMFTMGTSVELYTEVLDDSTLDRKDKTEKLR